jgi:glycosyltransferase involved in cell wall biosynthesis
MVSEHASPLALLGGVDAGGQNVHVDALARSLAARGHEVVVHTRRDDPTLPATVQLDAGVTVHHVDAGPREPIAKDDILPYVPAFAAELRDYWSTWRPDVVHAHFWMSGVAALQGTTLLDIPMAITFHALGSVKRRYQAQADTSPDVRIPAERRLVRAVDTVIATCRDEVSELIALGADPQRIETIPCGVHARSFEPDAACHVLPPRRQRYRLVSLSRLVPRKGVAEAVRMLAHLPDTELVVAGGPPAQLLHEDPEVVRLRQIAQESGVSDRVVFAGAIQRAEVPALLSSADVAVCLPWYEPFGIVPLEVMACGKPLVGTAVGGLLDSVEQGRTGLLVPPRSVKKAAAAVRTLLEDAHLRDEMGNRARARVLEHFDWCRIAQATEAAYEALRNTKIPERSVVTRTAS